MLFPRDRKLARSRGLWPRVVAVVGLAAFSCTLPNYEFNGVAPESCDNDMLDGDEIRVDCGGSCDPCTCEEDEDCSGVDQVCVDGACQNPCEGNECGPSCFDTEKNGDETDEDCGGTTCDARCPVGDGCKENADCEEKVCDGTECLAPACDDDVQNGGEMLTDCGGPCEAGCPLGAPCRVDDDCDSLTCVDEACVRELCDNDVRDPDESDVDCGDKQSGCARCPTGAECTAGNQCVEGVCDDDGGCAAPSCDDGVKNGAESDEDCGGGCDPCGTDQICEVDDDCVDQICNADKLCQAPACDDEIANGDESDVDCGGDMCDKCPVGDGCREDGDCVENICDLASTGGPSCVSCDDDKRNGDELGPDCGGPDCDLCQPGNPCTEDEGCVNYLCNDNDRCDTGLTLDYKCGQCGDGEIFNEIKFSVTLHNLSNEPIDVSDVDMRYYLTPDGATNITFGCTYGEGGSCGSQELIEMDDDDKIMAASHYVETRIGSREKIPARGSVVVEIRVPFNGAMWQTDYSFMKDGPHLDYQRIVLYRQGTKIWGDEP